MDWPLGQPIWRILCPVLHFSALDDGFDEALKVDDDIRESNDNADCNGLSLALSALAKGNHQSLSFFGTTSYEDFGDFVILWRTLMKIMLPTVVRIKTTMMME